MENDTTVSKEGLLEPVLPGSVTFDSSILAPLRNSYFYEESRECFAYNSAYLINNAALQRRYSAFRAEKQHCGYSEEELEESFGFLFFDDPSEANKLADTGLVVGQGTCTTLGDSSKGVYISKYSDCLDLKRWYDGKTGCIVLLKLTKGRVKEVTENYTQNFTPPSTGFDCHVSEQLRAVCASTSSFLAFERTQYYLYELLEGSSKTESCPRHVCPFAIVAFSYGKTAISLELKEKSQEKTSFRYQPWRGQLKIESIVYDVGLKSTQGAMFPANLPKTVNVAHAIGISELRKMLPEAIFETSLVGEVSLDGRCFSLYDVVSCEARSDLSVLTHELREKDMALVIYLDDGGFLVLLHSSHFLSYEGAETDKASALQGMFIFPDSRTVPRETKIGHSKSKVSPEVLQVLPALNYAESEMEKCPPNQQGDPISIVEKHLQNFATLFFPGLSSIPAREASMFPDQYDVPDGFPLIAPKWTEDTGARIKTYMKNPYSFQISIGRTLELLAVGKQQRSDDHDDDVYYYISSPEEAPQTPFGVISEKDVMDEADHVIGSTTFSDEVKNTREQQAEKQKNVNAEQLGDIGTTSTVGVTVTERMDVSPKSCDLLTESCVNTAANSDKTFHSNTASDKSLEEHPIQSTGVALISLTESESDACGVTTEPTQQPLAEAKVDICKLDVLHKVGNQTPDVDKEAAKDTGLTVPVSPPIPSVNHMDTLTGKVQPQTDSDVPPQAAVNLKLLPRRRGRRKRRSFKRNPNKVHQSPVSIQNTTSPSCSSIESSFEQSESERVRDNSERVLSSPSTQPQKKDWRSLPRRKRHWNADISMKRVLRSDIKATETKSLVENSDITGLSLAGYVTSTPKRKMEGPSMRERYGLKTIFTNCGRMFVPHGSDAAPGNVKTLKCTKDNQDSSPVTPNSTSKENPSIPTPPITHAKSPPLEMEKNSQHLPLSPIQNSPVITLSKALSSQQAAVRPEKDEASHHSSDQSPDSDLQPTSTEKCKGKIKNNVYRAISISKLKTVLKRAKMTKSPGPGDHENSQSDNGEPEVKKGKPNVDVDLKLTSGKLSPHKDMKDKHSASQDNSESGGNPEPTENAQSKQNLVSWRELKISSSQEKLMAKITKENGCITLDTPPPFAVVKQADHQLISTVIGDRAGGKNISSDVKSCKEAVATGASPPSDALNLLADLALSANSEKMANLGEKPRQDTHVGVKISSSPESVLHSLLQGPTPRFNLPSKSPYPKGLVVAGDLMLDISEEHSYSQPTSLLSGLSGACPQVESLLSLSPGLLKLPDHTSGVVYQEKGSRNGWKYPTSLGVPPSSDLKAKEQRSKFLRHRRIFEKEGSIQVMRPWRENYDFRFDSKFTNEKLDKTVTRALHGKWDFGIEDTYEQVHLIFHMWIGLFYSKATSRLFHFDHNCPPLYGNVSQSPGPVPSAVALPDVGLSSKEDRTTSVPHGPDILDLSLKTSGPVSHCTLSQGSSGEDQPASSGKRSRPEHITESKKSAVRASSNLSATDSTVDDTDGNSVFDCDDYSDTENDNIAESPYTKLLENNSAYSNLCEQTLSMHIDEQKSEKAQKNEPLSKSQGISEVLRIKGAGNIVSGTLTSLDPKALAIFHQVVGPARHVIHPKMLDQVHGRKIILKSLSFKDKCGGTAASVSSESVPKYQECEAALGGKSQGSAPVVALCGNIKDKGAFENLTGHGSASSVAVHGGNTKLEAKSLLNTRNNIPMNVLNENNKTQEEVESTQADTAEEMHDGKTKEQVRPMPDVRNVTSMLDIGDDISANKVKEKSPKTACEVNVAKDEIKPKHDGSNSPVNIQDVNDAKGEVTPVHSVQDDKAVDVPDVNESEKDGVTLVRNVQDDTAIDAQDINNPAKDGIKSVHSVGGDNPVDMDNVNESAKDGGVTPVHKARDDTAIDAQDINDAAKDGVKPVHSVRGDQPADVEDENTSAKDAGITSVHCFRDDMPINIQDKNITPVQKVNDDILGDVQDVNYQTGVTPVQSVDDIPADVQGVNDKTGVTPVQSVDDIPADVQGVNDKTGVTPVQSVDDMPADVQDVYDKTGVTPVQSVDDIPADVQDVHDKTGVTPVQSVDDIPADVQDVHDKMGVTPVQSVDDDTVIQDVNDKAKEKTKPKSDVRDCESVSEDPAVDQTERTEVDEKGESNDIKAPMVENDENKMQEEKELLCNNTNISVSENQNCTDDEPLVSALEKDATDDVHVEMCDKKTLVEQIISTKDHDILKLHVGEVTTEMSVVNNDAEQTRDYAQLQIDKYSSADHVNSKAHDFFLKEGHSSPAVSDMCTLTENDESTVLHPSPIVQNNTPEINQLDPNGTYGNISSCTAVINQEAVEVIDSAVLHEMETPKQTADSRKDYKSEESGTGQKHFCPSICERFTSEIPTMSSGDSRDVSTPAVQVDSALRTTSRSSTPTQDELPYTREVCEDLSIQQVGNLKNDHNSEQPLHSVSHSPAVAELTLDNSVRPNTSTERPISSSPYYKVQSYPQGPYRCSTNYEATGDLADESRSLTHKPAPNQTVHYLVHEAISSQDLVSKEGQSQRSQKYQYGHFSEQYEELSSELSARAHGSSFKTDGPSRLRDSWNQDSEGFSKHFSISVHRGFAYMPNETTENESHIPDWVHQIHYVGSRSTMHESNERAISFRHQSDLSLSESNEESESRGVGSICYSRKKSKMTFSQDEWDEEDFDGIIDYSIKKTFSCGVERTKTLKTHTFSPYQRRGESKQTFDWCRYFRREGVFKSNEGKDRFVPDPPSSIVTVFDKKGNRVIFESPSTSKRSIGAHGVSMNVKDSLHNWEDQQSKSNITQSLMELEYLIFSEKMNLMLKNCKVASKAKSKHRLKVNSVENLMTIRFSRLDEEDTAAAFDEPWTTLPKFKINVDMSERKSTRKINYGKPLHLQSLFCNRSNITACSRISDITKECAKSYNTMMNDVCTGKTIPHQNNKITRKWNIESAAGNKQSGFCGRIKKDMFDDLHDNLNSVVRQACKIKYMFYILVTSSDPFFEETKELLEAEGHTAIEPYQFDMDGSGQTPLLILLRNEDIAEHICEVPHLLELKKSSRVLFAGIDRPDDVVNLTHQELFGKGGFVVFDEAALDTLTLENMKKVVSVMEELDKKGKWKWFLHYRDSRKLRENARCNSDAQKRKHFIDCCQEAGIVEGLPYHECDVISHDRPDYLRCLVRLQIQNVSARFPVFITDTPADSFGKNGILTMNIYTFSRILSNDTCLVS